ncbi:MAG: hypothetical protein QOI02_1735 [Actinomycetota bacterium]|nr:hypothetical protein [Actinomycetota bacterium]
MAAPAPSSVTSISSAQAASGLAIVLKSRIMRIGDVADALERIAAGGWVVDSALVQELVTQRRRNDPLSELTLASGKCSR